MARIMIIDDEKIVGDIAKLSLEQEGHEVETFVNSVLALDRIRDLEFDVVVTDLKMKGKDGFEVLRVVKGLYPGTKVIMITAFANLDVAIEAIRGGVHDFFPKPFKMKELKESIKRALDGQPPLKPGGLKPGEFSSF
ncbi:MAG: response regulator [Nitrospiraceae bacterium]|nr:response regulator [Nitrospiraceae bacterium]MDA8324848.1 response regulator [Nitrospiraceae bacterium]